MIGAEKGMAMRAPTKLVEIIVVCELDPSSECYGHTVKAVMMKTRSGFFAQCETCFTSGRVMGNDPKKLVPLFDAVGTATPIIRAA